MHGRCRDAIFPKKMKSNHLNKLFLYSMFPLTIREVRQMFDLPYAVYTETIGKFIQNASVYKSPINQKEYYIQEKKGSIEDNYKVCMLLSKIEDQIHSFLDLFSGEEWKKKVKYTLFVESDKNYSYTLESSIMIALQVRKNGVFHEYNKLLLIALHEVAHIMTPCLSQTSPTSPTSSGISVYEVQKIHGKEWRDNYRYFLERIKILDVMYPEYSEEDATKQIIKNFTEYYLSTTREYTHLYHSCEKIRMYLMSYPKGYHFLSGQIVDKHWEEKESTIYRVQQILYHMNVLVNNIFQYMKTNEYLCVVESYIYQESHRRDAILMLYIRCGNTFREDTAMLFDVLYHMYRILFPNKDRFWETMPSFVKRVGERFFPEKVPSIEGHMSIQHYFELKEKHLYEKQSSIKEKILQEFYRKKMEKKLN